jgi:hypothetical protein
VSAAEEREKTAAVVARDGAVPVPFGPGPLPLTADERAGLADLIGDVKAANAKLLNAFGESVRDCREHEHPKSEDFHCLNLTAWMGERAGLVLRRLLDVEAENGRLRARAAVLEEVYRESTVYADGLEDRLSAIEAAPFSLDADRGDEPQTVARGLTVKEAAFRLIADTTSNPANAETFRQAADEERARVQIAPSQAAREDDVSPQVAKLRGLLAGQRAAVEDPHDGPLSHSYRIPRDLPESGGTPC